MSHLGALAVIAFAACSTAQGPIAPPQSPSSAESPILLADARRMFAEADALCAADNGALWGHTLCGPMMFADRATRFVVANRAGSGALAPRDGMFVGRLPEDQSLANTAFRWAGETWTQLIWPLPTDRDERAIMMMHERFHRVQDELGLAATAAPDNAHLDEPDGRYYLQLEWRALSAALRAHDAGERDRAVGDALAFRAARRSEYPTAAARENALEMNEGLAEYTGVMLGVQGDTRIAAALHDLESHVEDPSFVRSFAYATGPAYGLLLDRYAPGWRATIAKSRDLAGTLADHARIAPRSADAAAADYGGPALRVAETERVKARAAALAKYRHTLVDGPVLVLPFAHIKINFDPRAVVALADLGSVYPTVRISDDWGVLEVTGGALVRSDWSAVVVSAPAGANERAVPGSWQLELVSGWELVPGERAGDFRLSRAKQ